MLFANQAECERALTLPTHTQQGSKQMAGPWLSSAISKELQLPLLLPWDDFSVPYGLISVTAAEPGSADLLFYSHALPLAIIYTVRLDCSLKSTSLLKVLSY